MAAPKGNRFWEARSSHGRKPIWDDPQELLEAASEYFEWVYQNPLVDYKPMLENGQITNADIPKMRAMTIEGLSVFLGIARSSWDNYKHKEGFLEVVDIVENTIRTQKLEGAAAGLLNANIIARDLKLRDGSDDTVNGSVGLYQMDEEEIDAELARLRQLHGDD